MAAPPVTEEELVARYGPHLNETPPGGWNAGIEIDREVKTHCCFCGQQCGIILKVKDDEVVGFEPWYEFPFNEGKLCPKGVKRYLQNAHPDRLLEPLERDPSAPGGFRPVVVGPRARPGRRRRSAASRPTHGPDAFAMLSGVSLDNEKSYLIGKFARLGARHREPRLQRSALHGVGRRRQQEGARHRPGVQPVERHPARRRGVRRRREHRRVRADHHELRSGGPATAAPSSSSPTRASRPIARTADVFLGLRPGTDSALHGHDPARADRARLARPRLHPRPHRPASRRRPPRSRDYTPAWARADHRRPGGAHRAGGRAVGHREDRDAAARPRDRAPDQGRRERAVVHQPRPGHRQVRQAGLRRHARSPARATARAAASTATSATSSPATATSPTPSTAPTSRRCGAATSTRSPARASPRRRSSRRSTAARSRACCRSASTPSCRCPTRRFTAGGARPARVLRRHRLLPLRDRRSTPTSCCPARCTRRTRAPPPASRAGSSSSTRRSRRPATPGSTGRSSATSPPGSARATTSRTRRRRRSSRSSGSPRRAAPPTTPASPGSASSTSSASSGRVPTEGHPGHAAPLRRRALRSPTTAVAASNPVALPAAGRGGRRRVPDLAHHRPGRQPVPVGHPDPAHRPARRAVPRAAVRDAPDASPTELRHRRPATSSGSRRGGAR